MSEVADRIRAELRAAADPSRAAGAQAYMKSAMPFLGVRVPEARAIAKRETKGQTDAAALRDLALELWDEASHREERYAALAVLAAPPLKADPAIVPIIEHVVRTGQWWDFTDELAHRIVDLLEADPLPAAALVRGWSVDPDFWIRRVAIIAQLGRRERTDPVLLADVIEPNLGDSEFFIRKAIGWALRDYARTAPDWVRDYVAAHPMSGLSRREALKHL
ncbi:DNA alkylation repair protein [Microbacterium sp. BWT-B31]|uniref:DNA alkylation repair protein n=1 Tax=Microbacterium sp. BWT-B31 TaxID=3232072 RepID=UPI00352918A3